MESIDYPNKSIFRRVGVLPRIGGVRDKLAGRLRAQGIFLDLGEKHNYALINAQAIHYVNKQDGVRDSLLLHGRDLFVSQKAYQKFAAGGIDADHPEFLSLFKPQALVRIYNHMDYLSEESAPDALRATIARDSGAHDNEISTFMKTAVVAMPQTEELLDALKKARREHLKEILFAAVKDMADPFSQEFLSAEYTMANHVAMAVEPRVLDHLLERHPAFLISSLSSAKFRERWGQKEGSGGFYQPSDCPGKPDIIAASVPSQNVDEIFRVIRHECEHALDYSNILRFAELPAGQIEEAIVKDRASIEGYRTKIHTMKEDSPAADRAVMRCLAAGRLREGGIRFSDELGDSPKMMLLTDQMNALNTLSIIHMRIESFMPKDPAKPHPLYTTKEEQYNEIVAVMDELKARYGKTCMKAILPNLYEATRYHKLNHPALRRQTTACEKTR